MSILAILFALLIQNPTRPAPAEVTVHRAPAALSSSATTENWSQFLGRQQRPASAEAPLKLDWDAAGPPLVWEIATGSGYAGPAIHGKRLVLFHRVENEERIECRDAETGAAVWTFGYPSAYSDRYNFGNGPRAMPVTDGERVYAHGVEGPLHCLDLKDGKLVWSVNTSETFSIAQDFFGVGATPLLVDDRLIVVVGSPKGPMVVAFDKRTGKQLWKSGETWRAGYASPVLAELHGKRWVLVFAGSDDDPPTGGLLAMDPEDGSIGFRYSFRSKTYASVNASNPVVHDNRIMISSSYRTGAVQLHVKPDGSVAEAWKTGMFGAHFATPVYHDGHVYGVTGSGKRDAELVCLNWETGERVWEQIPRWSNEIMLDGEKRTVTSSVWLGSVLQTPTDWLVLGEMGHLARAALTPQGYEEKSLTTLFFAGETWCTPVISHGLLYIMQNKDDRLSGKGPRLLCYDLRG